MYTRTLFLLLLAACGEPSDDTNDKTPATLAGALDAIDELMDRVEELETELRGKLPAGVRRGDVVFDVDCAVETGKWNYPAWVALAPDEGGPLVDKWVVDGDHWSGPTPVLRDGVPDCDNSDEHIVLIAR
jgi:hypothetical protein